jgi:hypothetical protein
MGPSLTSTNGGATWLGLDFSGNSGTGGTGCPSGATDAAAAKTWLQTKYIAQGYCCAAVTCSAVAATPAASLVGQLIGSSSTNVCTIVLGTSTSACQSYVRYRFIFLQFLIASLTFYVSVHT